MVWRKRVGLVESFVKALEHLFLRFDLNSLRYVEVCDRHDSLLGLARDARSGSSPDNLKVGATSKRGKRSDCDTVFRATGEREWIDSRTSRPSWPLSSTAARRR